MNISDRIFDKMSELQISQKKFSEMTGIPQSTISDWKKKGANPASDKLLIIADALEMNLYDLLSETQSERIQASKMDYRIVASSSDENILIEKFEGLSKAQKQRVIGYIDALNDKGK